MMSSRFSPWLRSPRRPSRPRLEVLEDRCVPATALAYSEFADVAGVDTAGNVYVFGRVDQTTDLDPGPATHWLTGPAQFLAKYTPGKELLWAQSAESLLPNPGYSIYDVAISSASGQDFVHVMGFMGSEGPRSIARFQDTGTDRSLLWRTETGRGGDLAIGADGAVYMSYMFEGTYDFDPSDPPDTTPLTGDTLSSTGQDGFLAKWDTGGTFQWVRHLGGTGTAAVTDLAVVHDGVEETIYVGGMFDGTFTPQGHSGAPLTDQGVTNNIVDLDGYLVGYDTGGSFVSVGQFVDAYVTQVAGDASGIYIAGFHYWAALGLPGNQHDDIYFGRLDASAQSLAWVQGLAGPTSARVNDLLLNSGSLLLTGYFTTGIGGSLDFDPGPGTYNLTAAGGDAYVASYSATAGTFQWARQMGDTGTSLAVSGTDLYVGGYFGPGQFTFGTDTVTNTAGGQDGFVVRMGTNGTHQWVLQIASVVRTLDNGDSGYSEGGSGWKNSTTGGYGGDARYHAKGNGSNSATWAFAGLPAGTYEVLATWKANTKNASNAPYTLSGSSVITVTKNQRVAPATYSSNYDSDLWESLGTMVVSSTGTLTVTLRDQANGNVVADAIQVIFRTPPAPLLAASGPPAGSASQAVLTESTLAPLVQQAIDRWASTGLSAGQLAALSNADIRIADLGGATLGLAAGNTIWLDDDAAGWGWFLDPTPGDDSEFSTPGDQGEQGRMDLLTALMHEMGHVLGLGHDEEEGVMHETLEAGVRETLAPMPAPLPVPPIAAPMPAPRSASVPADRVFASGTEFDAAWLMQLLERKERRA